MLIKWVVLPVIMLLCAFGVGVILGVIDKELWEEENLGNTDAGRTDKK